MNCVWCDEPVLEGEQNPDFQQPMHCECAIRSICGSLAHLMQECGCFIPGSTEGDAEGLTKREAAFAAACCQRFINLGFEARSFKLFMIWCEVDRRDPAEGLRRFEHLKRRAPDLFADKVAELAAVWAQHHARMN
jgi:hypothetical protein